MASAARTRSNGGALRADDTTILQTQRSRNAARKHTTPITIPKVIEITHSTLRTAHKITLFHRTLSLFLPSVNRFGGQRRDPRGPWLQRSAAQCVPPHLTPRFFCFDSFSGIVVPLHVSATASALHDRARSHARSAAAAAATATAVPCLLRCARVGSRCPLCRWGCGTRQLAQYVGRTGRTQCDAEPGAPAFHVTRHCIHTQYSCN